GRVVGKCAEWGAKGREGCAVGAVLQIKITRASVAARKIPGQRHVRSAYRGNLKLIVIANGPIVGIKRLRRTISRRSRPQCRTGSMQSGRKTGTNFRRHRKAWAGICPREPGAASEIAR